MTDDVYKGHFSSWEDVVREFTGTNYADFPASVPNNPDEVLYARYHQDMYDGCAFVIWREGEKYYTLYGSHCSCYGLEEGGWDPEEYQNKELLLKALEKSKNPLYCYDADEDINKVIWKLKDDV